MDIKSILLGFLMHRSMTGYELKKFFQISFSFFSGISFGSIYPALKKMAQDGLVTMKQEIQDGAPNRKIYTITDSGRDAFIETLKTPLSFERAKSPFLTQLFFFAHLSKAERLEAATQYLESIKIMREGLTTVQDEVEQHADRFQYLCFQFGVRHFDSLVENMSEVIKELEKDRKGITDEGK